MQRSVEAALTGRWARLQAATRATFAELARVGRIWRVSWRRPA